MQALRRAQLAVFGVISVCSVLFCKQSFGQCATPAGDQVSYGNNYWIGYAYTGQMSYASANYDGYFNEPLNFNENFCGSTCSFAINGCSVVTDNFSVRFKMTKGFTCGDYTFTIGGDDGVRLSLDGGSTFLIDDYSDHGYRTSSVTTTLAEGNYNLVLEYYENNGGNEVSFSYTAAAGNTNGPGQVGSDQLMCQAAPFDPAPFTSISDAVFCLGPTSYQWQQSTDQFTWTDIAGATSNTYDQPPYTTLGTIYFRRSAISGVVTIYSNLITVTTSTPPGDPSVFGSNTWNAYGFNSTTYGVNYYGFYTEDNLSFNTINRWPNGSSPSAADGSSGLSFSGCAIAATGYTASFKRTNFTCGYYQIDIPYHDDDVTVFVNGTQVFQHIGCCDAHTNVYTGFLGPSTKVEIRFANFAGPGSLAVNVAISPTPPVTANTPTTVCPGFAATLTATSPVPGVTYSWAPDANNTAATITSPANAPSIFISPVNSGNYIVTITDGISSCTSTAIVPVTVAAPASTSLAVSPTTLTTNCPQTTYTFTASGADIYIWSADTGSAGGLSATTGFQVTATPQQTTTYTVLGSTGCGFKSAQVTITVNVPSINTFPTNTWNVYGFNTQTIGTSYVGYYTEDGSTSAPNTYSFDTQTRWNSGDSPSNANAVNGNAWIGCPMNADNISLSFKRSGFACGVYQLDVPGHDDDFLLFINGVQVAQHTPGCCDSHTNVWTGSLNPSSQVEWQLLQGNGGSFLQVQFTNIIQPVGQSTWLGGTSSNWFDATNWCGGIPTSTSNVLIPAAGPQNMPSIAGAAAQCHDITINPAIPASGFTNVIAAASMSTINNNLNVYGNWINNGAYSPGTGSITFVGLSNTISTPVSENFYDLIINKTAGNTVTFLSGTQQVAHAMTLTSGIVNQNTTLQFLDGSSSAGGSNTSYVDGVVTKIGINAFTFPLGTGGFYKPIGIGSSTASTDSYTAQFFNTSPLPSFPNASRDATLDHISNAEYWVLNRTSGSSNVNVTLSWNSNSGGVGNLSTLRVANWNGATWKDLGNSATTGNTTAGTVTSALTTSAYGPFALSTSNNQNTLPVTLVSFECHANADGTVNLRWSTASELNNDYFEIDRSIDGVSFYPLQEKTKGAGTSQIPHDYLVTDNSAPAGNVYYRLKQVDLNGNSETYAEICGVDNPMGLKKVTAYPNPAGDVIYIDLNNQTFNSLLMMNSLGEKLNVQYKVDQTKITISSEALAAGMYIIKVILNEKISTLKVIVE